MAIRLGAGMILLHFVQKLLSPYFWKDFWHLMKLTRYRIQTELYLGKGDVVTVLDTFLSHAKKRPKKPFIIYEGDIYTYKDVDKSSSRVAHVFLNHSTLKKRGHPVALLMTNEPHFVHDFSLAKLGCVVAFLNSNIHSNSLLHCIGSCEPRALVVGSGLPKAAAISQIKVLKASVVLRSFGCTTDDIIYITLPLYHSSRSLLGIDGCIELGATCVLKKKLSASQFWNDCKKHNVTAFQYIGELCHYLCKQPKKEEEKDNQVCLAVGNVLWSDIWREFLDRFRNIKICEFYGATESNLF